MSKHTPGPWTTEKVPTAVGHSIKIEPIGACIYVDTRGGVCRSDPDSALADARLIAAAPDLLAACEELAEIVSSIEAKLDEAGLDIDELVELRDWWRRADDAIAKAKRE